MESAYSKPNVFKNFPLSQNKCFPGTIRDRAVDVSRNVLYVCEWKEGYGYSQWIEIYYRDQLKWPDSEVNKLLERLE
jgi:hypothetical protein